MYETHFDQENDEFVITGPDGFKRRLPAKGVGIVLRYFEDDEVASKFAVPFNHMTEAERIACALEIYAYPV